MPIATIIALIQAASVLLPELAPAIPLIQKGLNGTVTAADIQAMDTITQSLNAQAAAGA